MTSETSTCSKSGSHARGRVSDRALNVQLTGAAGLIALAFCEGTVVDVCAGKVTGRRFQVIIDEHESAPKSRSGYLN